MPCKSWNENDFNHGRWWNEYSSRLGGPPHSQDVLVKWSKHHPEGLGRKITAQKDWTFQWSQYEMDNWINGISIMPSTIHSITVHGRAVSLFAEKLPKYLITCEQDSYLFKPKSRRESLSFVLRRRWQPTMSCDDDIDFSFLLASGWARRWEIRISFIEAQKGRDKARELIIGSHQ